MRDGCAAPALPLLTAGAHLVLGAGLEDAITFFFLDYAGQLGHACGATALQPRGAGATYAWRGTGHILGM